MTEYEKKTKMSQKRKNFKDQKDQKRGGKKIENNSKNVYAPDESENKEKNGVKSSRRKNHDYSSPRKQGPYRTC